MVFFYPTYLLYQQPEFDLRLQAKGSHAKLEKEAVRVVKKLPKMASAKQRGVPMGVKYTLPIKLEVRI